jgi:hypothetical protein
MLSVKAPTTAALRAQGPTPVPPVERQPRKVLRRDTPVTCQACLGTVPRVSRQQRYCSARCKEKARKRVRKAGLGGYTGLPSNPPKSANKINGVRGAKSGPIPPICGPRRVLDAEVFGGHWDRVVSDDGVACHVRRKPAARKHKAEPAAPDTKPAKARKGKCSSQAEVTS